MHFDLVFFDLMFCMLQRTLFFKGICHFLKHHVKLFEIHSFTMVITALCYFPYDSSMAKEQESIIIGHIKQ